MELHTMTNTVLWSMDPASNLWCLYKSPIHHRCCSFSFSLSATLSLSNIVQTQTNYHNNHHKKHIPEQLLQKNLQTYQTRLSKMCIRRTRTVTCSRCGDEAISVSHSTTQCRAYDARNDTHRWQGHCDNLRHQNMKVEGHGACDKCSGRKHGGGGGRR